MSKLDLRIRNLKSGEEGLASFDTLEEARAWLRIRPPFVEVSGVASPLDRETSLSLKAEMRSLSPDEKAAALELETANARAMLAKQEAERKKDEAKALAHEKALASADPNRPIDVHWTFDGGMRNAETADKREITEDARKAVVEWIHERNGWVKDRGQIVGEARLMVYPNKVPDGEERVKEGRFFPVTAPKG